MKFDESLIDESEIGYKAVVLISKNEKPHFVDGKFGKAIRFYNKSNSRGGEMVSTTSSTAIKEMVEKGIMSFSLWAYYTNDSYEQAYLGVSAIHGWP